MNGSSTTDWIQAIAASLGAIGLIWTLNLQRKSTNEQIRLRFIEEERDRRSMLPIFRATLLNVGDIDREDYLLSIILAANPANLVKFEPVVNDLISIHLTLDISDLKPGDVKEYKVEFLKTSIPIYLKIMTLTFLDVGYHIYNQEIYLTGTHVTMTDPALDFSYVTQQSSLSLKNRIKNLFKIK